MLVRDAEDRDVEAIRDLFVRVYGDDYPFPGFYDTHWLKKSVYDDDTIFLVAETDDGIIVATASIMLDVGDHDDLLAELGRLVAESTKRARGAAEAIIGALHERIRGRVHFVLGEVRTVHRGSQRLAEQFGWTPVGFEPLKYQFQNRESVVFYAQIAPEARELRRNNPRIIPEAARLAQTALQSAGMPVDVIVEDETDGYPTGQAFEIERLRERGVTPLLRIERGRVRAREVFGHFSLSHGFFRMADGNSHYLVARDGAAVLGAVGFSHDPIDSKIRIFELIEFDDAVKGYLLASVDRLAREEFDAAYLEVDVSAYAPKIQRTLERLGFVPVAYCPSMVFENVERLDVLRMAKVRCAYEPGRMRLLERGQRLQEIVEQGMEDRLVGMEISAGARKTAIFDHLPDGDLHHLARIGRLRLHEPGLLIRRGDPTEHVYILVDGAAEARCDGRLLGALGPGEIFGEMGLLQSTTRSADVVLIQPSRVIEIPIPQLERLLETHPRLGFVVMRNLARGLSEKLRRRG